MCLVNDIVVGKFNDVINNPASIIRRINGRYNLNLNFSDKTINHVGIHSTRNMNEPITVILPTYNEATNLPVCLQSLVQQDYPLEHVEVLIIDGGSTDNTIEVANKYLDNLHIKVLRNDRKDCHFGKYLGIENASNDLLLFLDADNVIVQSNWLSVNVKALNQAENRYFPLVVESYYLNAATDSALCNYLMTNLYIGDPFSFYIVNKPERIDTLSVDDCTVELYQLNHDWPTGANGFFMRKSLVKKYPIPNDWFAESDYFAGLAKKRKLYLMRVKGIGIYHHYLQNWRSYYRKKLKIGRKYFTRKKYGDEQSWITNNGKLKIYVIAIYLSTFFLPLFESIVRVILSKDIKWMLHPFAGLICIFAYLQAAIEIKIFKRRAF
jgi:glycosyltransferase involved in cell wall biosynthesis